MIHEWEWEFEWELNFFFKAGEWEFSLQLVLIFRHEWEFEWELSWVLDQLLISGNSSNFLKIHQLHGLSEKNTHQIT